MLWGEAHRSPCAAKPEHSPSLLAESWGGGGVCVWGGMAKAPPALSQRAPSLPSVPSACPHPGHGWGERARALASPRSLQPASGMDAEG